MGDKAQPSCCPKGSWGAPLDVPHGIKSFDDGAGESFMIGTGEKLEVYVAKPDAAARKKAIVVFTDVYGLQNRLFAILDKLATDLNLYVAAIDCFRGQTKDNHKNDFINWTRRHPFEGSQSIKNENDKVHPVGQDIDWCLKFLSAQFGVDSLNVGAIGFCWGVWAMTKACAMGLNFRCGVGFHPSLKIEDMSFGTDHVKMTRLAAEHTPFLFCIAGNDLDNLKPPDGEVAQIISSSKHGSAGMEEKHLPKCVEFPEQLHGWVSRGDTSVEKVKEDAEKALKMAAEFLSHWMG